MSTPTVGPVDNHLLFVAKPAGVPCVPDASGDDSLLASAKRWVADAFDKPGEAFLGVVHRLDRPVSGVVCFARTSKAAARLTRAFADRRVSKRYRALVLGGPEAHEGRVVQWLRKDRERNRVHAFSSSREGAKEAVTRWRVLDRGREHTLVELEPETGRPHQLRVAMASLGCPIAGDLRYGADAPLEDRSIALHARFLEVPHPTKDARAAWSVPEPDLWKHLR